MNKAQSLRLIEVTSQTQANNGTVCFYDPITNCDYMSYESGYVRRKYVTGRNWRGEKVVTIYQLNKTRQVPVSYVDYYGNPRTSTKTERILEMDPEKRMETLYRGVANYRRTLGKI
jgi:hypothetical protein